MGAIGYTIGICALIGFAGAAWRAALGFLRRDERERCCALLQHDGTYERLPFGAQLRAATIPAPCYALSCPQCAYEMTLDDLSLVGKRVPCPSCARLFLILEPHFVDERDPAPHGTSYPGIRSGERF